jgi:hypothetical protein
MDFALDSKLIILLVLIVVVIIVAVLIFNYRNPTQEERDCNRNKLYLGIAVSVLVLIGGYILLSNGDYYKQSSENSSTSDAGAEYGRIWDSIKGNVAQKKFIKAAGKNAKKSNPGASRDEIRQAEREAKSQYRDFKKSKDDAAFRAGQEFRAKNPSLGL